MKTFFSRVFSRRVLFIIEALLSALLIGALAFFQLLPLKYFIAATVLVVLVLLLLYRGQQMKTVTDRYGMASKANTKLSVVLKFVQVLVCAALVFANYTVFRSAGFIDSISGKTTNKVEYSVIVLKSDTATKIADLKNYAFGYMSSTDSTETAHMNQVVAKIGNDLDETVTPTTYSSAKTTVNALYNGTIKAMIINELDRSTYKSVKSKFSSETRVIKHYYVKIASASANKAEVTKEPFVVFISGIDTYGSISKASLSDVNMIATINPVTKQILLTSVPRDYYIPIAGTSGKDKLTHSAKKGISCTMETIENLLNTYNTGSTIKFNYYVKMNYTSFMKVVDALGGVTINNPYGEFTTRIGFFKIKKGKNTLTAKQALAFVRERHSFADGDRVRVQNQQLMIKAIMKKMTSASSITKLNSIFNAVSASVETNMSSSEIRSLINMEIDDMATWDIQSYHLDGTNARVKQFSLITNTNPNGLYVMQPNTTTIKTAVNYIQQVLQNKTVKIKSSKTKITADPNANDKYK